MLLLISTRYILCNNIYIIFSSFISLTDKVLREISIVEIVGCTLNMCFLGYYSLTVCILYKKYVSKRIAMSKINVYDLQYIHSRQYMRTVYMSNIEIFTFQEWETKETTSYITYIVLLISLTFNIFIFCYIGELVAEKVKSLQSKYLPAHI